MARRRTGRTARRQPAHDPPRYRPAARPGLSGRGLARLGRRLSPGRGRRHAASPAGRRGGGGHRGGAAGRGGARDRGRRRGLRTGAGKAGTGAPLPAAAPGLRAPERHGAADPGRRLHDRPADPDDAGIRGHRSGAAEVRVPQRRRNPDEAAGRAVPAGEHRAALVSGGVRPGPGGLADVPGGPGRRAVRHRGPVHPEAPARRGHGERYGRRYGERGRGDVPRPVDAADAAGAPPRRVVRRAGGVRDGAAARAPRGATAGRGGRLPAAGFVHRLAGVGGAAAGAGGLRVLRGGAAAAGVVSGGPGRPADPGRRRGPGPGRNRVRGRARNRDEPRRRGGWAPGLSSWTGGKPVG
ncbi:hypothetical protein DER30_7095 [Streptomyces sp. HB202]|nr:hypothetical protein DER30_7095 [Streptomyces sp. HB202]